MLVYTESTLVYATNRCSSCSICQLLPSLRRRLLLLLSQEALRVFGALQYKRPFVLARSPISFCGCTRTSTLDSASTHTQKAASVNFIIRVARKRFE